MTNTATEFVKVPETFEGWAMLHEFFKFDWSRIKALSKKEKESLVRDWIDYQKKQNVSGYRTAYFGVLGHKGDILGIHFKESYEEFLSVQTSFQQLSIASYMSKVDSYVSVVELGVYEFTVKLEEKLLSNGLTLGTDAWKNAWSAEMAEQRERIKNRLYQDIPQNKYVCFYPMNKRRGEQVNWYTVPMKKRQEMMRDHGMIGRKYAGQVTQIISGSIGYDDWEWGVDLFSDDPIVFKKLVYEMRFDEASALYGEFGPFCLGVHLSPEKLLPYLEGAV